MGCARIPLSEEGVDARDALIGIVLRCLAFENVLSLFQLLLITA